MLSHGGNNIIKVNVKSCSDRNFNYIILLYVDDNSISGIFIRMYSIWLQFRTKLKENLKI